MNAPLLRVFGLALLFACARCEPRAPNRSDSGPDADASGVATGNVLVSRVLDGDTVIVSAGPDLRAPDNQPLDGERVRLIGIDTPEVARNPNETSECFGDEASSFTRSRVGGRLVTLEFDFGTGIRDIYGRLLAYVSVDDEVLNEALLREGYAEVFRRFSFRDKDAYLALEAEAKREGRGLWSACP